MYPSQALGSTAEAGLRVLIAGAGIGGLAAAVVLRQQGHRVEIFEKSSFVGEIGAALFIPPNCTVVLERMGLKKEDYEGLSCSGLRFYNQACQLLGETDHSDQSKWPADFLLAQRYVLHAALKNLALTPVGPGTPVKLHTSAGIAYADPDTATITLINGSRFTGDMVIGADGVHSKVRPNVAGRQPPLISSGYALFRWLVPVHELRKHPEAAMFYEKPGGFTEVDGDHKRRIITYPCKEGTLLNCGAFVPKEEVGEIGTGQTGYDQAASKTVLLKAFEGFPPAVGALLNCVPEDRVLMWEMFDMAPLESWIRGKVALLGDAAHPYLPYTGQGAAQAIEDGITMGLLLSPETSKPDIPDRLKLYEQIRLERAHRFQEFGRQKGRDPNEEGPHLDPAEFVEAWNEAVEFNAWDYAQNALEEWRKTSGNGVANSDVPTYPVLMIYDDGPQTKWE